MAHETGPAVTGRLFGPEMLADPYPVYRRLRESDPVHWDESHRAWFLTRHADVDPALRSSWLSADRTAAMQQLANAPDLQPFFTFLSNRMLYTDPPRHTRLRLLVNKAFTPHAVEARAAHIQQIIDRLLDRVQPTGTMDVVRDFAFPLPGTVIAELLGVPPEDRDRLKAWSDAFVVFFTKPLTDVTAEEYRHSLQAVGAMSDYFRKFVDERRAAPRDDLLSVLVRAEEGGARLTDEELYGNANLLLVAGHETTTGLIGSGLLALLRNPEQMRRLRDDPALIPTAVEEFIRYDGPVHFTHRLAAEDHEIDGKQIRKGDWVHLVLAAANRDPATFPEPDRLDVGRTPNHHVGFGAGLHFCVGAPLARLEAKLAFTTLLQRFPNLKLATEEIPYRGTFNARGPASLPVTF